MSSAIPTDAATIVIFGGSGDLSKRKLVPALFELHCQKQLPPGTAIVGYARSGESDETYRAEMKAAVAEFARRKPVDEADWSAFASRLYFYRGDLKVPKNFSDLKTRLEAIEKERGLSGNRIFYLAIPPSAIGDVVNNLGQAGFVYRVDGGPWSRVIVEKPFGRDLESARALNEELAHVFRERQIFRIDHYLGKETTQNILVLRLGNGIFEPLWNRRYVDHVQITVAESIGIETRGAFYEQTGASRDVLQNHLLQLVSLIAMEPPATFEANALRDEKVKVLRAIDIAPADVHRTVVRGQYGPGWVAATQVRGYRQEPDVDPESETETFVAARFMIDDWRWSGVPFYVRTGKRLPKRATEIAIQYREVPHRLFKDEGVEPDANLLAIRIQPDEGIMLRFGAKVPGLGLDVRSVTMDFTYGAAFSVDSPDAYETLILDALQGDASLFTRADEVEEAWSIVDPIVDSWASSPAPEFPNYDAGTWGPEAAEQLLVRDGRRWRRF